MLWLSFSRRSKEISLHAFADYPQKTKRPFHENSASMAAGKMTGCSCYESEIGGTLAPSARL
jgi:hypothetical protein